MKTDFEHIVPDKGSSFRLLYQKVPREAFAWNYHYHPEYEIVCVYNGTGRRHVGNHLSHYHNGDLVLIGSNVPHAGFGYDSIGEHEELVLQFSENFMGENFFQRPEMSSIQSLFERSQQGIQFYGKTQERVGERLKKMRELSTFDRMLELLCVFQDLANSDEYHYLNASDTRYDFKQKDQIRLRNVYHYVEQNFKKDIDIQEVANISNLTVPAFCNYFKKTINQTFTDFLNEYRVKEAAKLLMDGYLVADVCYQCGFNSVSYFGRVFRSFKGMSPSAFQQKFK